jgi:MerR family mercuric resistance operon transcriptional regulator
MPSFTTPRAQAFPIGSLAKLTGVNIETIRYYERIGVMSAPARLENGRRIYGPHERRMLAFIRRSRELGFSLDEVRALLALGGPERAPCEEVRKIASAHLDSVRSKLADLVKLETILAGTVARCSESASADCPVLDMLDVG